MQSLSEVKTEAVYAIKWTFGNPQVTESMHQHDIREGSTINVLQHRRGSMAIGVNNIHLAIGNEVAGRIKVRGRPSISWIRGINGLEFFSACRITMQLVSKDTR